MIAPDYRVITVDETAHWDDAITAITGRIAGVYVVNFAEVTHLCSMTGSYWGEFLRNITENYIREPDGFAHGQPIWDDEFIKDSPEDYRRSLALASVTQGACYGITYENGGESGSYFDERALDPSKGSKIDMEGAGWVDEDSFEGWTDEQRDTYRKERDQAAFDAAREYENNGEEWDDIAPWAK